MATSPSTKPAKLAQPVKKVKEVARPVPAATPEPPRRSCLTCSHFVSCQTANALNSEIALRIYLITDREANGQSIYQCFDKLAQFCRLYLAAA